MLYKLHRTVVTSTGALDRARALLGAAQRRQDLFAQALVRAEAATETPHPIDAHAHETVGRSHQSSLDSMVSHISEANDQDLLETHHRLNHARLQALREMAGDSELASFMAVAYGTPGPTNKHPPTNVVDVLAREVAREVAPPERPDDMAAR